MSIQRRQFSLLAGAIAAASLLARVQARAEETPPSLAFIATGKEYRFDTGALRGKLRADGKSQGLGPVEDIRTGKAISGMFGLFSPYRLLTSDTRFGTAAWDWASRARLLDQGAVEVQWQADQEHPLEITAQYRFAAADTIDLTLSVKPKRELHRFELFLASYFEGCERSFAFVRGGASKENSQKPRLLEATRADGYWQVFPRDDEAKRLYGDGRWKRPPNPVDWVARWPLAAPLAVRRDGGSHLAVAIMAGPAIVLPWPCPMARSRIGRYIFRSSAATSRRGKLPYRAGSIGGPSRALRRSSGAIYQKFTSP